MCTMLDYNHVVTCSRDPVIKIWNIGGGDGPDSKAEIEFKGHEMSVSTVAVSADKERLASGGRDCTTRIWDIEKQKSICKRQIARNVITQVKWLANQPELIVETSEDLYLRMFDIRIKPFKPIVEIKVDTNFATTCDIWSEGNEDKFLVTGHRIFNGAGTALKLWDLRKLLTCKNEGTTESLTEFVYEGHEFSPESVRFIKPIGAE